MITDDANSGSLLKQVLFPVKDLAHRNEFFNYSPTVQYDVEYCMAGRKFCEFWVPPVGLVCYKIRLLPTLEQLTR